MDNLRDIIIEACQDTSLIEVEIEGLADKLETALSDLKEKASENKTLRKLLWLDHGCPLSALYGDDGEMQCHKCMIDFKRTPAKDIEGRLLKRALDALIKSDEVKP